MKSILKIAIIPFLLPLSMFGQPIDLPQNQKERDSLFLYATDLIEVDLPQGMKYSRKLTATALSANDTNLWAQALLLEGTAQLNLHHYAQAENAFQKALNMAAAGNDSSLQAKAYYLIGTYRYKQGDLFQAISLLTKVINYKSKSPAEALAMSHYYLARTYLQLEKPEDARHHAQELQNLVKSQRLETYRGRSLNLLARLAIASGQYNQAQAYLQSAELANRKVGNQQQLSHTYALMAKAWRELNNQQAALQYAKDAVSAIENTNDKEDYVQHLVLYSRLAQNAGRDSLALITALKADSLARSFEAMGPLQHQVFGQLADLHLALGDSATALRNFLSWQWVSDSLRARNIRERLLEAENLSHQKQLQTLSSEKEVMDITVSRSKILLLAAAVAIVIISLLLVILWRSSVRKKRYSKHLLTKNKEITSHKKQLQDQQEELLEKNKKLEELDKNKNKIFSVLSHDLRQPINQIRSVLDLIEGEELTADERKHIVENMRQSLDNSSNALENLLLWSKNQLTGIHTKVVDVHLLPQVWQLESHLKPVLEAKKLKLELDVPDFFKVPADMNQLDICLKNLVNNAIKFSNSGSSITIKAYEKGDKKYIDVKDEGVGMTPEQLTNLRKLNGSFSTVGTMNEKGTGLGIMITQDFMLNQNGDLEVKSTLGKGTTFSMIFPKGEERALPGGSRSLRKI